MKWVLIAIQLSTWDGHVIGHEQIAAFATKPACIDERDKLNSQRSSPYGVTYICGENIAGGAK